MRCGRSWRRGTDGLRGDGRAGPRRRPRPVQLGGAVPGARRCVRPTRGDAPMTDPGERSGARPDPAHRRASRILSQGTSQFDSRAQRIARSCVAAGDTVTIYSRFRRGLPREELLDGYRIVRLPLSGSDARAAMEEAAAEAEAARPAEGSRRASAGRQEGHRGEGGPTGPAAALSRDPLSRATRAARATSRRTLETQPDSSTDGHGPGRGGCSTAVPVIRRFRQFPWHPMRRARWFERQVEPHDIWHGMWAGSLPALVPGPAAPRRADRLRRPGRVPPGAAARASMPGWERRVLTWFERRWAHAADAVIQVSEPYARDDAARPGPHRPCPWCATAPTAGIRPSRDPTGSGELLGIPRGHGDRAVPGPAHAATGASNRPWTPSWRCRTRCWCSWASATRSGRDSSRDDYAAMDRSGLPGRARCSCRRPGRAERAARSGPRHRTSWS